MSLAILSRRRYVSTVYGLRCISDVCVLFVYCLSTICVSGLSLTQTREEEGEGGGDGSGEMKFEDDVDGTGNTPCLIFSHYHPINA